MFGRDDMKLLVKCASRALETENRYLADCFKARGWKGHEHGICENQSERYYQFLIWSELMSAFPWRPKTEYDKWDLVFFDNETDKPAAYAEIKLHFNFEGILHAMDRLAEMRKPGVMLILTCWQTRDAKKNLGLFTRRLGVSRAIWRSLRFRSPGTGRARSGSSRSSAFSQAHKRCQDSPDRCPTVRKRRFQTLPSGPVSPVGPSAAPAKGGLRYAGR